MARIDNLITLPGARPQETFNLLNLDVWGTLMTIFNKMLNKIFIKMPAGDSEVLAD